MAEPLMPTELWMFWVASDESSRWLVSIDECSGADDLCLVAFSEATAKRIAKEQAETYFGGEEDRVIPVRIRPTPPSATKAMLEAVKTEWRGFPASDLIPVPREVLAAFLAEWDQQISE